MNRWHHLVLILPQVPGQLLPQLDDCGQAHFVPAAEGVDGKWEEGDCLCVTPLLIFPQLGLVTVCMLHCTSEALATRACWRGLTTVASHIIC